MIYGARAGLVELGARCLAQALADVATAALVQDRAAADKQLLNKHLQMALDSRVVLEQAKGVLSHSGGMDMAAAYSALRTYSRDYNIKLTDLSQALVSRTPRRPGARSTTTHAPVRSATPSARSETDVAAQLRGATDISPSR